MAAVPLIDVAGYLRRLGLRRPGRPDIEALHDLHAAHASQVAYEILDIHLSRPAPIDPHASIQRILQHRGGYCFHLNGAASLLLAALGYQVRWHRGGVQNRSMPGPPGAQRANHLALTVHGLPTEDCPAGIWLFDVGLGDALHQPLPLSEGSYRQGPFELRLRPSDTDPGGWRLDHDPQGRFVGMDFGPGPVTIADFQDRHRYLSTHPDSAFVRTCVVQRRDAAGADTLTGCDLQRIDLDGTHRRVIDDETDWFMVLADIFNLPLPDLTTRDRARLWARVHAQHAGHRAGATGPTPT